MMTQPNILEKSPRQKEGVLYLAKSADYFTNEELTKYTNSTIKTVRNKAYILFLKSADTPRGRQDFFDKLKVNPEFCVIQRTVDGVLSIISPNDEY